MSGIVRTFRPYSVPRASAPGPRLVVCPVLRLYNETLVRALPNTMSGSRGSGAAIPYSWMLTGCQSWKVISPSIERLSTHAEPESCCPPQTRYGNALSAVAWYIAAVFCVYQLLHDAPRFAETTAPWSETSRMMSG